MERFLILGSEGGSYDATEKKLTRENANSIVECLNSDPIRAVKLIVDISSSGRAPKNDPAIFALAIASGHDNKVARKEALSAIKSVCRTATHLFQFVESTQQMRGWGRGLRSAVASWYDDKGIDSLMYQVTKYAQRGGWSHRDLFRLSHPKTTDPARGAVYRYIVTGSGDARSVENKRTGVTKSYSDVNVPDYLIAFQELKRATVPAEAVRLIQKHGFTHEMVPSELKGSATVWEALLEKMPMTALIRNLAKLTSVGVISPLGSRVAGIAERLQSAEELKRARVHPIAMLSALHVYAQGYGEKGSLEWSPNPLIVDALNEGFYQAFGSVEPTGKATLLAIDVSASMTWGTIAGVPGVNPRAASAALAMVTARVEPNYHVACFDHSFSELKITPKTRLDDALKIMDGIRFGATDCALPITWARDNNVGAEVFHVYTDSDTNCGSEHPHQALASFRKKTGIPAKLAVVGMQSSGFTIADPNDAGQLDVVGFDLATPQILSEFARQTLAS